MFRPYLKVEYQHRQGQTTLFQSRSYEFGQDFKTKKAMVAFQEGFESPAAMLKAVDAPSEIEKDGNVYQSHLTWFCYMEV